VPVLAYTPREGTYHRLALAWGVTPIRSRFVESPSELLATIDEHLCASGLVREKGTVVIVTGTTSMRGATSIMRIHRVGEREAERNDVRQRPRNDEGESSEG